ncbi:MAG: PAS domain-containing protein [Myxococcales bacterium]|jgi:PAS domain S-box-containing protein
MADDDPSLTSIEAELEALREREALLSEAAGVAGVGAYYWIPGKRLVWSDEFYRVLGYRPGEVEPAAENFHARIHPDDRERVLQAHSDAVNGRLPEIEYRIRRADTDEERHIRGTGRIFLDSEGGPSGRMVGALWDITHARQQARRDEMALVTMRAAERLCKMGTFVAEMDPVRTQWSTGMYEITGLTEDASLEERHRMTHPEDREIHGEWYAGLLEAGTAPPLQVRFVRADGEVRHALTHATMRRFESDGVDRVVGTTMDVTEQVLLEERLRHAAKMEAVGSLAAGVAHDFNNYLMVVAGCLDLLERGPADAATREELTSHARHGLTRCTELTQQLLAFARRRPASKEIIDLAQAVSRIGPLLQPSLGPEIRLALSTDSGVVSAHIDEAHLEQLLANLAIHARDAIRAGEARRGEIEIRVDQVVLTDPQQLPPTEVGPGRWARICVRDDGAGIEPQHLQRIFEPYFTTKTLGRGTGLGLSSVYGMVRQHRGHVTVQSALGEGTTFAIWLPAANADPDSDQSPGDEAQRAEASAGRVLVVDDLRQVRRVAALSLRGAGYAVAEAADAEEALSLIDRGHFDLVLTDVRMPGRDGVQLAEELAERRPGLPVVLMSGYADAPVERTGLTVLFKPFSPDRLLAEVRAHLQQRATG